MMLLLKDTFIIIFRIIYIPRVKCPHFKNDSSFVGKTVLFRRMSFQDPELPLSRLFNAPGGLEPPGAHGPALPECPRARLSFPPTFRPLPTPAAFQGFSFSPPLPASPFWLEMSLETCQQPERDAPQPAGFGGSRGQPAPAPGF